MKTGTSCDLLPPAAITKTAENVGYDKTVKKPSKTFLMAALAGMFISIAFVFYITVTTGTADAPYGWVKLIGGICFSLGLILVVICGGDLFTSTVLTIVAKASNRITWKQLAYNWTNVYFGNLVGALFFVGVMWFAGEHMAAKGAWGLNILQSVQYKLGHSFVECVFLGLLANLMVCLAVWMSYSGRTLIDKAFIMILPVSMFVAGGFEHSIANMFLIPMGIVIKNFASPEFWQVINMAPEQFSQLTVGNFISNNLIPVTIGNILGGCIVGLSYWVIFLKDDKNHIEAATKDVSESHIK